MKPACLAVCCLALAAPLAMAQGASEASAAQAQPLEQDRIWSIRVSVASKEDIRRLSEIAEHFRIDAKSKVATLEVGTRGVEAIRSMGLKVGSIGRIRPHPEVPERQTAVFAAVTATPEAADAGVEVGKRCGRQQEDQ